MSTTMIMSTTPPYQWLPTTAETLASVVCSFEQKIVNEAASVNADGMKYYLSEISYNTSALEDSEFMEKMFEGVDTGGTTPTLFDPITENELDFVFDSFFLEIKTLTETLTILKNLQTLMAWKIRPPTLFDRRSQQQQESFIFKEGSSPNQARFSLADKGVLKTEPNQYGRPIFQVNLDPGFKEINVATKLKLESYDDAGTASFCTQTTPNPQLRSLLSSRPLYLERVAEVARLQLGL